MSGALYLPGADRTSRWFYDDFPNPAMPRIDKTLLHSTETQKTGTCPGYSGGATAPQITINPWAGHRKVWQHFPINRPGRALRNPASTPVSENKDNVFQIEIIGFSDPVLGKRYNCYLPNLTDSDLDYLARQIAFVHEEWPHPLTLPSTWPLYKVSSWAAMDAAHMTSAQYDLFRGILSHLHAPRPSTHGDAALNIRLLVRKVDLILNPPKPPVPKPPQPEPTPPTPTPVEDDMPRLIQVTGQPAQYLTTGAHVYWLQSTAAKANAVAVWGLSGPPKEVPNLDGLGEFVGPRPPA